MQCISYRIKGHVQGVFYRAATEQKANELGITGFARNEPDGSVTVVACGDPDKLAQLENWLWIGPKAADVTGVVKTPSTLGPYDDFQVLR